MFLTAGGIVQLPVPSESIVTILLVFADILPLPYVTKVCVFCICPPAPPPAPPDINVASMSLTIAGTVKVFVLPAAVYSTKPAVGAVPPPPPAPITVTLI